MKDRNMKEECYHVFKETLSVRETSKRLEISEYFVRKFLGEFESNWRLLNPCHVSVYWAYFGTYCKIIAIGKDGGRLEIDKEFFEKLRPSQQKFVYTNSTSSATIKRFLNLGFENDLNDFIIGDDLKEKKIKANNFKFVSFNYIVGSSEDFFSELEKTPPLSRRSLVSTACNFIYSLIPDNYWEKFSPFVPPEELWKDLLKISFTPFTLYNQGTYSNVLKYDVSSAYLANPVYRKYPFNWRRGKVEELSAYRKKRLALFIKFESSVPLPLYAQMKDGVKETCISDIVLYRLEKEGLWKPKKIFYVYYANYARLPLEVQELCRELYEIKESEKSQFSKFLTVMFYGAPIRRLNEKEIKSNSLFKTFRSNKCFSLPTISLWTRDYMAWIESDLAELCGAIYGDTDCLVVPDTKENRAIFSKYNEKFPSKLGRYKLETEAKLFAAQSVKCYLTVDQLDNKVLKLAGTDKPKQQAILSNNSTSEIADFLSGDNSIKLRS